jgi:hypothetical protein
MSIVKLPLTGGFETIVDNDIAEKIEGLKLYYYPHKPKHCLYPKIYLNGRLEHLHRIVMNSPEGMHVDHINGDPLDNRRENLRIVNRSQNLLNRRKEPHSKSGYRIVFTSRYGKWRIQFKRSDGYLYCGQYSSRHIAAFFADQILVQNVGYFVQKNFPEKITSHDLLGFLRNTKGRIFRVVFSRRSDGKQREMVCRTGVNCRHNNGTIPFDPSSKNLFSVYDVHKRAYRFIPLENVICIRFAKKNYRVVA